jgi:hypothetical protein
MNPPRGLSRFNSGAKPPVSPKAERRAFTIVADVCEDFDRLVELRNRP